jgi:CBS domain-containing protein
MVTKLVTVTPDTDVFEAIANLLKQNFTAAPVVDEKGNYLAVFSERPCLSVMMAVAKAAGEDKIREAHLPSAKDVMAKNLVTLRPTTMCSTPLHCCFSEGSRAHPFWTPMAVFWAHSPR